MAEADKFNRQFNKIVNYRVDGDSKTDILRKFAKRWGMRVDLDDDAGGTRGDGNKFVKVASYATGSVGGSVIGAGSAQIIELPTPAQSWSGSDGAGTGNVTFVYRGGL